MNALQQILTTITLSTILTTQAENIMNGAIPITGKHSGEKLTTLGTPFHNKKDTNLINLIDNNGKTTVNTWKDSDLESHSYFGVLWPTTKVNEISKVVISLVIYPDGGWFGVNRYLPLNKILMTNHSLTEATQPILQITDDLGKTWKTISAHSNYLKKMDRQTIPEKSAKFINHIVFTVSEPVNSINGIRVIGTEGGRAGLDPNGFVALSEFKVEGKSSSSGKIKNIIMGLHSGKDLTSMGTLYHNKLYTPYNMVDNNPVTSCDTWNQKVSQPYGFAGILYNKPLEQVTQIKVAIATHVDGGWFGVNSSAPVPGSRLTTEQISEKSVPLLQSRNDQGKTWQTVSNQNNYLTQMLGHKIGKKLGTHTRTTITFTPDSPLTNITGIRVIGTEGGSSKGDLNGFICIEEFEVSTDEADSTNDSGTNNLSGINCQFDGKEFSWKLKNEAWVKEYRVINRNTNETILITPAVAADIYSIDIASGIKAKLQIVDVYGKSHDINPNEQ